MSRIVGIGANVCDMLITADHFPKEDTKQKVTSTVICGGGPCATGLVAASKLGEKCAYIGNITDDPNGVFLKSDFEKYGVSTQYTTMQSGYTSFSSYILLAMDTATRTCVFHKGNVPPLELNQSQKKAITDAELLMVDGNDINAAIEGAKLARENGVKVLYDAGGLYEGVENLLPYADILIPSEEFALAITKERTADAAAKALYEKYSPSIVVITQGKEGGIIYDGNEAKSYPAFVVDAVDTNGSGDVFHGAFAYSVVKGWDYYKACIFSSAVSALKCTKTGARSAVPSLEETYKFLKERGIDEFEKDMD